MNINDIPSVPCAFTDANTNYALCYEDGTIFQCYQRLADAQFMLEKNIAHKIFEVAVLKGKIRSVLGEV